MKEAPCPQLSANQLQSPGPEPQPRRRRGQRLLSTQPRAPHILSRTDLTHTRSVSAHRECIWVCGRGPLDGLNQSCWVFRKGPDPRAQEPPLLEGSLLSSRPQGNTNFNS